MFVLSFLRRCATNQSSFLFSLALHLVVMCLVDILLETGRKYCNSSFSRLQMNDAIRSGVIATEIAKRNAWLEEFESLNPVVLSVHMAGIVKKILSCFTYAFHNILLTKSLE